MVSTYTPNVNLEEPARGDYVGTWDTPVNGNTTVIDLLTGAIATIALNNTPIVLSAAQFRSKAITFNSTLTGSVTITFPTSFIKSYEIQHLCTGSSAYVITLTTTAAGGEVICVPPGEIVDVVNDGTNIRFKNLGRVGEYWDYAGSSLPNWVSGCTKPPYLICNGTTFSSATYPVLFGMIGATLPDARGRARLALDAGAGRVSSGVSGIAGNTLFGAGGDQYMQAHAHTITDPGHGHLFVVPQGNASAGSIMAFATGFVQNYSGTTNTATTGITVNSNGAGAAQNMQPSYVGGLTLIRAG